LKPLVFKVDTLVVTFSFGNSFKLFDLDSSLNATLILLNIDPTAFLEFDFCLVEKLIHLGFEALAFLAILVLKSSATLMIGCFRSSLA